MSFLSTFNSQRSYYLAVVLAAIGLFYIVHVLTLWWAVPELPRAKARIKTQRGEIASLRQRLEASEVRQKVSAQEANIIRQANQLLRKEESSHQEELQRLKGELDFYQRLAGTSGTQTGLAVYHLELNPTASGQVFHFILTLTQNLRRSAITSGKVHIDIEGTLEDRPVTVPWTRVGDGSQQEPEFRFKYFQQLDGYLALPEQFRPSHVLVSLEAKGQNKHVSRKIAWIDLVSPGELPEIESSQGALELEMAEPASRQQD
jgi:hypothetical protein